MRKSLRPCWIKSQKVAGKALTVLVVVLSIVVKEMMMKVAEVAGIGSFFAAYFFGITVYIAGGFSEFVKEMKKSFGPMPATV